MISAKIVDPESKREFMNFIHGTTSIVAVPHGADSELQISTNRVATLVVEAGSEELSTLQVNPPGASIRISELKQPLERQGISIADILSFGPFRHRQPKLTQRLYKFRAVIENGTPNRRGKMLATFDFHLLCEVDFHWARAFHLDEVKSDSVTRLAEGTCSFCQEARARLQKDWKFEDEV